MLRQYSIRILAIGILTTTSATLFAVPIAGLFNTGVDNSGNAWGSAGVPDIHYSVIASPSGAFTPVTVDDTTFPIPPWVANNSLSRWIGPAATFADGPVGSYTYRTTFTLPTNAILSSASISGLWGTDDLGLDILINANSTSQTSGGFTSLTPFSVTSGFVTGLNTLDFVFQNAGGPTGLRVDDIRGTVQLVPEPTSLVLCLIGLGAAVFSQSRIRSRS